MRARKPCVRLRLMTLGWNVRFMTAPENVSGRTCKKAQTLCFAPPLVNLRYARLAAQK